MVNLILLSRLNPLLHSLAVFNLVRSEALPAFPWEPRLQKWEGAGMRGLGAACSCTALAGGLAVTPQQTPNWDLGAAGRAKQ